MKPTTPIAPAAAPAVDLPQPQAGGSYTRCPDTGALTLTSATQPVSADNLRHQADDTTPTAQEP